MVLVGPSHADSCEFLFFDGGEVITAVHKGAHTGYMRGYTTT
jgi:hypothetical protein